MYKKFNIQKKDLEKHIAAGLSQEKVAEIYGCSKWTIIARTRRYGLSFRSASKKGDKNPAKRKDVRSKISSTILDQYDSGKKMGFQKLKKIAHRLEVKKEKCEECGSKKNLRVHHIDGNQSNHLKTNLEVLCTSCHISKHFNVYMYVSSRFDFESAHELPGVSKCERLHGHSYKLEVTCGGLLNKQGMVINFSKLKEIVRKRVINHLDHYCLNERLKMSMPTAESLLVWIFRTLNEELKGLKKLKLWETEHNAAILTDSHFLDMLKE